jgi:hypothetical protein
MNRRGFLGLLSAAAALSAGGIAVFEHRKTFFLPPRGGWSAIDYQYPLGDVRRYGAVADGFTDDTSALQAALDDASRPYIGSGTYRISRPLVLRHPYTIIEDAHLIRDSHSTCAIFVPDDDNIHHCWIRNNVLDVREGLL